jgi:hypothetical protein
MPRAIRRRDEPVFDAERIALDEMRARSPRSSDPRRREKFAQRFEKARARWERMAPAERIAWGEAYLTQRAGAGVLTPRLPARESDRRDLFAVVYVADKERRRYDREARALGEQRRVADERRRAEAAERRAAEPATPPRRRPEPPAAEEAPKRKKRRRRGPAVGLVGYRLPGTDPRLYDLDD